MPIDDSRMPGFHRLSPRERREKLGRVAGLTAEQLKAWEDGELDIDTADRMIENVVGTYSLPIGVATNFLIDGKHYAIPFVVEEASVVAAASNMAKRCLLNGGFKSDNDDPVMIGQIQVVGLEDVEEAKKRVLSQKKSIIQMCNDVDPILVKFGGGCKDIEARPIKTESGDMLIVHLLVDCRDAMGANAVNTMAETVAPKIEELTAGTVILRIISNLAVHRIARVSATFTPEEMSNTGKDRIQGSEVINGVIQAYHFAAADPYRATTHNKGIMNAISSVAIACGQDWRAIESGAHAYAAHGNENLRYGSMTEWSKDENGDLRGTIRVPMAVGLVGGAIRIHPGAKTNVALLGVETADELGSVMAAAGLAQNLGALRALATVGIQAGHMKLHLQNMVAAAGAQGDEIQKVSDMIKGSGERITMAVVVEALQKLRDQAPDES